MRTALTLAASVVINVTALAALELSLNQAQLPPAGEVTVTQLPDPVDEVLLAGAPLDGKVKKVAGGTL